jgi:hypothetical protein
MKIMKIFTVVLIAAIAFSCSKKGETINLFNGTDLTGWDTYVGPAYDTIRKKFDSVPGPGLNNDPYNLFSVVKIDGKPAIRISGEHFGGLSTTQEFSNYHLTVQFKWGEAKHAPKQNDKRDSGLLYHGVGDHGADGGFWLRSQEFQVQEGDCGDYWGVAGCGFDIPVVSAMDNGLIYTPDGVLTSFSEKSKSGRHAIKGTNNEKPSGEWNTLELYCYGDSAIHVVNGQVTMRLFNSREVEDTTTKPLRAGKIQFQSEGAEVYYRSIELEKIAAMPDLD